VFVDFIGDGDHVVFHAEVPDQQKLLYGEYPARRLPGEGQDFSERRVRGAGVEP
jgi:hypothetical protein